MDPATALLIAGVVSSAGTIYQNQQNLKNTNKWNDVQVDLANTAHQREVLDLKAAGLNPILSASGAGASVPSLGTVQQENIGQGISDGISSASKYFSDEYKENVNSLKANTQHVNLLNTAQTLDNDIKRLHTENEVDMENAVQKAQDKVLGIKRFYVDGHEVKAYDSKEFGKAVSSIEKGIRSDLALRGSAATRAWITSARDVVRGIRDGVGTVQDVGIKGFKKPKGIRVRKLKRVKGGYRETTQDY